MNEDNTDRGVIASRKWTKEDLEGLVRPPLNTVKSVSQHIPRVWQFVDAYRNKHQSEWVRSCFLPRIDANKVLESSESRKQVWQNYPHPQEDEDYQAYTNWAELISQTLNAVAGWRCTKGIYSVHPEILGAIKNTPTEKSLPIESLMYLPEWSLYLPLPLQMNGGDVGGVFVFHNFNSADLVEQTVDEALANESDGELATGMRKLMDRLVDVGLSWSLDLKFLVIDTEGRPIFITEIPLLPFSGDEFFFNHGLDVHLDAAREWDWKGAYNCFVIMPYDAMNRQRQIIKDDLYFIISVLLYIVSITSVEPDGNDGQPKFPEPTITKRGPRFFPPDEPKVWEVSYRIGAEIAMAKSGNYSSEGGAGHTVRPHIRRAHWHRFWTGSRSEPENRKLVVHWLPPMVVASDTVEDIIPTVRPV